MNNVKGYGFRSSFGGYHKGQVHAYIAQMAKDIAKQNEEWEIEKAKFLRELQIEKEEAKKSERLREELACQYLDALSKIDKMMEHLTSEQQKNEELIAEQEKNQQKMEKLADFELTKESLAKAKVSLVRKKIKRPLLWKKK